MKLQTSLPLQAYLCPIAYGDKLLTVGSCFSENMGNKLVYAKFDTLINPLGTLFHPLAIENLFSSAETPKSFTADDFVCQNGIWHCWHSHSVLSHPRREEVEEQLEAQISRTRKRVSEASHLFITYGSAWVYKHLPTQTFVANCHKVPQKEFEKSLLSIDQIHQSLQRTLRSIKQLNPHIHLVFSLSPVRHLKDGFTENQRSKAHLVSALHTFLDENKNEKLYYFPAYELMMDEMRDYRFYDTDLVHPNALAIELLWERFKKCFFEAKTLSFLQKVEGLQKDLQHRPFHETSEVHKAFKNKIKEKIKALEAACRFISFDGVNE